MTNKEDEDARAFNPVDEGDIHDSRGLDDSSESSVAEPPTVSASVGQSGTVDRIKGKNPTRARPKSLLELIEAAYGTTSRLSLTTAEVDELQQSVTASQTLDEERRLILTLAAQDQSLRGLVNFLSPVALHASKRSVMRDQVSDLALAAFWQHSLFEKFRAHERTGGGLPNVQANRIWVAAGDHVKSQGPTTSPSKALRINAVSAFVLLRTIRDGWVHDDVSAALSDTLWASSPESADRPVVAAAILLGAGEYDVQVRLGVLNKRAAIAASETTKRLSAARAEASTSLQRATAAEARAAGLETEVIALETSLLESRTELTQVASQLSAELKRGSVARIHHADDYEVLRTQVLRRLSKQADLLADGLHALRNGSHGIAEEFVDRALIAITREIESLKDQGVG